jgi:Lrp/AsnC family transcriptional regulator, leucine-responsive regulatory protein
MIDSTDKKILSILQENARLSNAEIADKVGLTASSVHERVKKLEKKGILKGYVAIVDADKLGKPMMAFIRLSVSSQTIRGTIQKLCASEHDILECHDVAGEDCYILKVRAEGPKQLERLLMAIKSKSDSIRSVTNIVLSSYKETNYVEPARAETEEGSAS